MIGNIEDYFEEWFGFEHKRGDSIKEGILGLKQIWSSLKQNDSIKPEEKEKIFSYYTFKWLNRKFPDWMK